VVIGRISLSGLSVLEKEEENQINMSNKLEKENDRNTYIGFTNG
jgi:hypothetical protein